MPSITDWLMVGITAIYVIATIFICRANIKSAEETRKQTEEMNRQFEENTRAFVTVTFDVIRSGLIVLQIKNYGKRIANNVSVKITPEFIANIPNKNNKALVEKFSDATFVLGIGQSLYICLGSNLELRQMASELLSVEIDYQDSAAIYHETTTIDMTQYFWALMYESPTEDLRQEMKKVTKGLQSIDKSLQRIYKQIHDKEMSDDNA